MSGEEEKSKQDKEIAEKNSAELLKKELACRDDSSDQSIKVIRSTDLIQHFISFKF